MKPRCEVRIDPLLDPAGGVGIAQFLQPESSFARAMRRSSALGTHLLRSAEEDAELYAYSLVRALRGLDAAPARLLIPFHPLALSSTHSRVDELLKLAPFELDFRFEPRSVSAVNQALLRLFGAHAFQPLAVHARSAALDPVRPAEFLYTVGGLLLDGDRVLLEFRSPQSSAHAGLWDWPGGKPKPGEAPEETLRRELREELGIDSHSLADLGELRDVDPSSGRSARHRLYRIQNWSGTPAAGEGQTLAWCPVQAAFQLKPASALLRPALSLAFEWDGP